MDYEELNECVEEYPESDYYEDWDNLEMGFDPYMGCYSDEVSQKKANVGVR